MAYEVARLIFREIGSISGEAGCTLGLGEIALAQSNYGAARAEFEKARVIYHRIGVKRGEGNSEWRLGEAFLTNGTYAEACRHFENSMRLKRRATDDLALPGWETLFKARCAKSKGEAVKLIATAREHWKEIGLNNLIFNYIDLLAKRGGCLN